MCQKLVVKRYPIKSQLGMVIFTLPLESNVHKNAHETIGLKSSNI